MTLDMPAALLVGGASRRMGRPKADLPWEGTTLASWQAERLARLFAEVWVVAKAGQDLPATAGRRLDDSAREPAALHGLTRALEAARGRVFVLAVDLPLLPEALIVEIARRGASTPARALVPEADGRLQPLSAVWDPSVLPLARRRAQEGRLSVSELAREAGAEILPREAWGSFDPEGSAFRNLNTPSDLVTGARA
jgi:molybdopterin-guanine dinucleotide biosynthesis protein A